jgi:3-oxoacyl-[acyl-carrier-protein] synthase III
VDSVLEIVAYGTWDGGTVVDNSIYEHQGMSFKGGIPVNNKTIEERIGVRTRIAAPLNERIGVTALQNLINSTELDLSRVKLVIGATNVGEDKYDPGPIIRYPFDIIKNYCPNALVFDLYAGCPGFNVAVELIFVLSLAGVLKRGDLSLIVGAENIHRASVFEQDDTSNIIFGDDAGVTALETHGSTATLGDSDYLHRSIPFHPEEDFIGRIAETLAKLNGHHKIDGILIDNQLGRFECRIPASAARVQHKLIELMFPEATEQGVFKRFKEALEFYDRQVQSFAFDIMTIEREPSQIQHIARAYVESGRCDRIATVYLAADNDIEITIVHASGGSFQRPQHGIIDALTRTHGCFAGFIEGQARDDGEIFGKLNGKGIFLHATRGAQAHLTELLSRNNAVIDDIEMLIEHQANFAMIPLTLEQVLNNGQPDLKKQVADFIANKMVTNIHTRGNCSIVCMQRLPYDLQRDALKPDEIQGFAINSNLEALKQAKLILNDSVGAGMTRSSFLQRKK